ncbi:hypothetical protein MesoLj113a_31970 [Mesorhizobium sp. 113-1-2]|nr:hypothetical protein MesoLj113a_31970 [Mesorhizobium sp. 113-1-2]
MDIAGTEQGLSDLLRTPPKTLVPQGKPSGSMSLERALKGTFGMSASLMKRPHGFRAMSA